MHVQRENRWSKPEFFGAQDEARNFCQIGPGCQIRKKEKILLTNRPLINPGLTLFGIIPFQKTQISQKSNPTWLTKIVMVPPNHPAVMDHDLVKQSWLGHDHASASLQHLWTIIGWRPPWLWTGNFRDEHCSVAKRDLPRKIWRVGWRDPVRNPPITDIFTGRFRFRGISYKELVNDVIYGTSARRYHPTYLE